MNIPHCPNPECRFFSAPPSQKWYIRYGFHRTKAFGFVQRFRCIYCGRTFSTQTFLIDYYAKKIIDYSSMLKQLISASGLLDISRHMQVRPECIENRCERLSRTVLAIHADLLARLPMTEDFVADGFESFSYSQYYPNNINIIAGRSSEFLYSMGFANLRRKGRMTDIQKKKRQRLEAVERADPKAIELSIRQLVMDMIQRLTEKGITSSTLYTDAHTAYPRAFRKIRDFSPRFFHERILSTDQNQRKRYLFAVDYLDRQLRKDLSDHARETVQYAKCPSALMVRLAVYRFYHNCCIPRRVYESRRGNHETHAERAGISYRQLQQVIEQHWGKRAFLRKTVLCSEELKTWLCAWRNPGIPYGRYIPVYITV